MCIYTRKLCAYKGCRVTHRANFAYQDGVKIYTLTFNEIEKYGIDLVTHSFGFTMKYFKMTFYRFLRGNLAPGQETSIRNMRLEDGDRSMHPKKFQVPSTCDAGFGRLRLGPSNS